MSLKTRNSFFKIRHWAPILIISELLICACARIVALEGGAKDTAPPQLIKTYPTQACTSFEGKTIQLVFDKKIAVTDIYNQLVITPQLAKLVDRPSYTYSIRNKTLKLTLNAPLREQTTYTFNFNDAIKDTTEGNVAENIVFTFSTGDTIDTMYVAGQVKHLMTDQPASKAIVSLYEANNAKRNTLNSPPDYMVKTDSAGHFKLTHVKKGQYYIYAGTQKSHQLTVDPGVDEYGFLKDPIDLTTTSLDDVALSILKADIREFKLQSQQPQNQYFALRFSKPVADYKLTLAEASRKFKKDPTLYSHLVEDKQVIRIYNTLGLLEEDSIEAHLTAKDALGTTIEEPITILFKESNKQHTPAAYTFHPSAETATDTDFVGTMTVNKPVQTIEPGRLFFIVNGQHTIPIDKKDLQVNTQRDSITIRKQLDASMLATTETPKERQGHQEITTWILHIGEGAFRTIEGDINETRQYKYTKRNPKEYGTIKGTIVTEAPDFVIQLLDTDYKLVKEIRGEQHYQFQDISPGNYRIRILVSQEKGAAWCFGNMHELREPDPVIFYPDEIAVIANWEIENIDLVF
ncbi:MAG: Ig-like domain-containing domain [Bacteroidota bacterium]